MISGRRHYLADNGMPHLVSFGYVGVKQPATFNLAAREGDGRRV